MPTTVALEKIEGTSAKQTTIIRSFPDSWVDTNRNLERDDDEPAKVLDLGYAIEGGETAGNYRALVIGDVNLFADPILQLSEANHTLHLIPCVGSSATKKYQAPLTANRTSKSTYPR